MAYRRDSNLRDTLVRSKLHNDNEPPGTIACGRSNCRTCDHVSGDTKISTPSGNFSVRQSLPVPHPALSIALDVPDAKSYILERHVVS